jgi:hypothetical protein
MVSPDRSADMCLGVPYILRSTVRGQRASRNEG